ncbi:MAG: nitrite/sulfite reductase [Verrucomicrobiota bacterium]|nr:nitrite/sulfite reductase [Verrucomicrobiota bacterium]
MIDIQPNFAAVKQGLVPVTPQERAKLEKDGLDVVHDIYRYAKTGFASIDDADFDRMKWYGVYRQKPKDSGYFMVRTKIPGGQLNAAQARVLQGICDRFGHGFCDITTRQTIQFHWLRIEDVPALFADLETVGMTTSGACGDDTRNVTGCPVAGIDPEEIIDATSQLREISRHLTDNREFSNLPRKYKISVGGCSIQCTQPDINCVGVFGLVRTKNGTREVGYGIKVGGGLSAAPKLAQTLQVFLKAEQLWPVVEAVSGIYRDEGYRHARNKARFKFLVADWGHERVTQEVEARLGTKLEFHDEFLIPKDQETDHLGIHKQKGGDLFWVGVCFPGGRIRNGTLGKVADLAEKYCALGQDAIRLTNKQNLLLLNVPERNLEELKKAMDELGLDYRPTNFREGCVSCTGIEFCNLAVAETKNRMIQLIDQLEATSGWYKDKIRIHFSGCPSSCGQHQIADIGFRGAKTKVGGVMVDAYDAFIGGRLGHNRRFNELLKGKILASEVHLFIDQLLRIYDSKKQGTETFADFTDRVSKEEILAALKG